MQLHRHSPIRELGVDEAEAAIIAPDIFRNRTRFSSVLFSLRLSPKSRRNSRSLVMIFSRNSVNGLLDSVLECDRVSDTVLMGPGINRGLEGER